MKQSEKDEALRQADALIRYIDDEGGPVPTAINEQTGKLGTIAGAMKGTKLGEDLTAIQLAINAANEKIGEKKIGGREGVLMRTRDFVVAARAIIAACPVDAEPGPTPPGPTPVEPGPGGSVGVVRKSGFDPMNPRSGPVKWKAFAGVIYSVTAGDAGTLSWTAGSGGVWCQVGRMPDLSDAIGQSGASPEIQVAVGDVVYMRFPDGAVSQDCTVSIPR